jgi:hypothetical protein
LPSANVKSERAKKSKTNCFKKLLSFFAAVLRLGGFARALLI